MGVPGLWIGNPWAHRWRVRGQGAAARRIDHPERCEQGGYRRVRRGSARRSYPLHFRLSRARPRWLPEGSIHHGGRTGAARGCGGLSDGAEREGAAGTRSTIGHAERHGWRDLGPLWGGDALSALETTKCRGWVRPQRGAQAGCWGADPQVSGRTLLHWGCSAQRGACLYPSPGEGSVERGARTWTLRGDPGPGRAGELGAPRREALFHFPALLRFLRSVSLTSLNFTALGLRPTSPAPGRKRVPGLGAFPGQGVAPPGRARIRPGAPALCGAPSLRPPPLVPLGLPGGGSGLLGLRG